VLGLVLAEKHEYGQAADALNAYLRAVPNAPDSETVRMQLRNIELANSQIKRLPSP
jgi:regulator of sirC expression with transglutaminase-like and TPR domain